MSMTAAEMRLYNLAPWIHPIWVRAGVRRLPKWVKIRCICFILFC